MESKVKKLQQAEAAMDAGDKAHRKAVEGLRLVREEKLFKLTAAEVFHAGLSFANWPENGFDTFDDYVECRRGHTRQWATQEIQWLRAVECLEENGKGPYQFSKAAIQPIAHLIETNPEGFCQVYLDAAAVGTPVTEPAVKSAYQAYRRWSVLSDQWDTHQDNCKIDNPVPLTRDEARLIDFEWAAQEHRSDLVQLAQDQAAKNGSTWQQELPGICATARKLPTPNQLLSVARGDELAKVVQSIMPLLAQWDVVASAEASIRQHQREIAKLKEQHPSLKKTRGGKKGDDAGQEKDAGQDEDEEEEEGDEPSLKIAGTDDGDDDEDDDDGDDDAIGKGEPIGSKTLNLDEMSFAELLDLGVNAWERALDLGEPDDEHVEIVANVTKKITKLLAKFKSTYC